MFPGLSHAAFIFLPLPLFEISVSPKLLRNDPNESGKEETMYSRIELAVRASALGAGFVSLLVLSVFILL